MPAACADVASANARSYRSGLDKHRAYLLRIAEVEALPPRAHFQEVALDGLVEELIETYRPDMEAVGHQLIGAVAPNVTVPGDRRLLQQLLTNLLDNALRHTPTGTVVRVDLEQSEAVARLTVADDGPGVAPEDATRRRLAKWPAIPSACQ